MICAFELTGVLPTVGRTHSYARQFQQNRRPATSIPTTTARSFRVDSTTNTRALPGATMTMEDGKKRILVAIGNGSEEIETASAVDTFVRAGADVTLASVEDSMTVSMSRGMKFVADAMMSDVTGAFDAVALPGGMPGAERLRDTESLIALLKETAASGGVIAAVCASPAVVFGSHGLLDGKTATCYPNPAFRSVIKNLAEGDVVVDGNMITGTGPGTSLKWALAVVRALYGEVKAQQLADEMQVKL